MALFSPVAGGTFTLNASISSTQNTIQLQSFADPITAVPYTMTLLNTSIGFGTIQPKTSSVEFVSFTGITQNSDGTALLTGVVRGLQRYYPFTTNAAYQLPHSGQSTFILSDMPQLFQEYAGIGSNNIFSGTQEFQGVATFDVSPIVPTPLSSATTAAASVAYVNAIAIAGAPDASNTVIGITKLSVAAASPSNPIAVGQNDPILPTQNQTNAAVGNDVTIAVGSGNKFVTQTGLQNQSENYGVTTGSANAYVLTLSPVPTAYKAGQIIRFKTNFANTGAATINVNSLGAKTIQFNGVALTSGQLANGATYQAVYDGTNFQVSSVFVPTFTSTIVRGTMSITSGTPIVVSSLTFTPTIIRVWAVGVIASGGSSYGGWDAVLGNYCVSAFTATGVSVGNAHAFAISNTNNADSAIGDISAVTATGFTMTPTLNGNNAYLIWEAQL